MPLLAALALAVYGNGLLRFGDNAARSAAGVLCLGFACALWLGGEVWVNSPAISAWRASLSQADKRRLRAWLLPLALWLIALLLIIRSMTADSALPPLLGALGCFAAGMLALLRIRLVERRRESHPAAFDSPPPMRPRASSWRAILFRRIVPFLLASAASAAVWEHTSMNRIPPLAMALWFASALLWCMFFAPLGWDFVGWARGKLRAARRFSWAEHRALLLALLGIMVLGASFRLARLDSLPPEMLHSDHRMNLDAAYRISLGEWPIMFIDWAALEPMHYYITAAIAKLFDLRFDHTTLKLTAVIESLTVLPVMFWLGCTLMGRENRKWGWALGLVASALVAASYWHVAITRYAARPQLTVLFSALVMICLIRAIRHNRRGDFVLLGLCLGYAMYAYTACRVLPGVAAAGIGLALITRRLTWRERLRYLAHSAIAAFIVLMLLLPLLHFYADDPRMANLHIAVSVFGVGPEEAVQIDLDAFITVLMRNFRDAFLAFQVVGDHRKYHGIPHDPALDVYTGAFLILGLAAWGIRLYQCRRDPAWWLLPAAIVIMLLPSTLSIASPASNPSHTRMSGALPAIHLLAALPIVTLARQLAGRGPRRLGRGLALALCIATVLLVHQRNTSRYFDVFPTYHNPEISFRHMGKTMEGLVASDVPWGNIFIIVGDGFYFDTRNAFLEAGNPALEGSVQRAGLMDYLANAYNRDDEYRLNPNRDLVFIYSADDEDLSRQIQAWFPSGRELHIQDSEYMSKGYMLYRTRLSG